MTTSIKHGGALVGALALTLGMAACGNTVSANNFKGEDHGVAQTISDLQSDATAGNEQKVCKNDLASTVQTRLKTAGSSCTQALKTQLGQTDNFELTIKSISVHGLSASASVKDTYSGKSHISTLELIKEGKRWKVSSLG
jgi:hypothetical protein